MIKAIECKCTLDAGDYYRAGHLVICDICKKEYWRHPYCGNSKLPEDMGEGYFLHILCNGDHVKL